MQPCAARVFLPGMNLSKCSMSPVHSSRPPVTRHLRLELLLLPPSSTSTLVSIHIPTDAKEKRNKYVVVPLFLLRFKGMTNELVGRLTYSLPCVPLAPQKDKVQQRPVQDEDTGCENRKALGVWDAFPQKAA
ncbi:hypothetical protein EYF80_039319 [Liparis tanakae]|uniref:Uncharacterized protein n=1 Tax=Liparis tanakae TaxID=230148 RepID=A0A4Z2GAU3_9TELE|nr:hypothetical protein EYF80_039319 [Liparis tanakae]